MYITFHCGVVELVSEEFSVQFSIVLFLTSSEKPLPREILSWFYVFNISSKTASFAK